jgi:hypothetical protein
MNIVMHTKYCSHVPAMLSKSAMNLLQHSRLNALCMTLLRIYRKGQNGTILPGQI